MSNAPETAAEGLEMLATWRRLNDELAAERDRLIVAAVRLGAPIRQAAAAAGITRQTVYNITAKEQQMNENAHGARYLNDDLANAEAEETLRDLSGEGADDALLQRVTPREDGSFSVIFGDGTRIEFSRPESGDEMTRNGWDYCGYGTDGEPDEENWAPDTRTLAEVLASWNHDHS